MCNDIVEREIGLFDLILFFSGGGRGGAARLFLLQPRKNAFQYKQTLFQCFISRVEYQVMLYFEHCTLLSQTKSDSKREREILSLSIIVVRRKAFVGH